MLYNLYIIDDTNLKGVNETLRQGMIAWNMQHDQQMLYTTGEQKIWFSVCTLRMYY